MTRIPLTIVISLCVAFGCGSTRERTLPTTYTPTKAPQEELINRCDNLPETIEVKCPLNVFISGIDNFADLWEYSQKCGHRLTACQKFGAVDKAEMQGHLNKQTARADRNAKWIWYAVGGGLASTVLAFIVGSVAF